MCENSFGFLIISFLTYVKSLKNVYEYDKMDFVGRSGRSFFGIIYENILRKFFLAASSGGS
jgi:hypothetical protein